MFLKRLRNQVVAKRARRRDLAVLFSVAAVVSIGAMATRLAADAPPANPAPVFKQYCYQCHGGGKSMGGVNLEKLVSDSSPGEGYLQWQKVMAVLDQGSMPPKGLPQPAELIRHNASSWIRNELDTYIRKNDGDPGRVTVRRLTSGEYAYTMHDLTGLDIDLGIDASSDSVGGEGFTNFGDVQFMQDANLERYLQAAKKVAAHAVIGSGPLEFYPDPGKTGFELSAINRIKKAYETYGFRTVSGEGGFPYGLEKYSKVFFVTWQYRHRTILGEPNVTLDALARREGIVPRFAQHIWTVVNSPKLGYPTSDMVERWRKLPVPTAANAKAVIEQARTASVELQKHVTMWPSWLFMRGDLAEGGAGDESPLILNESAIKTETKHHFNFFPGARFGNAQRTPATPGPLKVYMLVTAVNPNAKGAPVVIWRNAKVAVIAGGGRRPAATATKGDATAAVAPPLNRRGDFSKLPSVPLRSYLKPEVAAALNFGKSPDGTELGPDDFATQGNASFEIPKPEGSNLVVQFDAELGRDHDQVFRIMLSDRADGGARGIPTRALIADPKSEGFRQFKAGFLELIALMPPNSQSEPTPADKDPIPLPFDSTYNVPEHDAFDNDVKYVRDDRFIYQNMIDDATRARVDYAWKDLYASFSYHTNYMRILGEHYKVDLRKTTIDQIDAARLAAMPSEMQKYLKPLLADYKGAIAAQEAARPRHIEDCLKFAARAWRRPLTDKEKQNLRAFYSKTLAADPDHREAIRALIARILVAPQMLYRVEQASNTGGAGVRPLSGYELASRMSYFFWSSIPDDELSRAAAAGELNDPQQIKRQAKRMLADPKARRLSTEFFGQWLGFYRFDAYKGVDTSRFPEFTAEVKESMYDEAVSFFEHVIRKDRPIREILFADYTFLNQPLAKFYGVKADVKSKDRVEQVDGANGFQRGGLLRLGAVLTTTSAPLRTSPVKRGDWILRRVLGTPVPPPPADAGSIPADDKMFGAMTLKQKLTSHKRNATCANCHVRIDPLGFSLEHFDSTGRWRDKYYDGKVIEDSDTLADKTPINGVNGLLEYLKAKEPQVRRTLSYKLLGYALGRTVVASDQPLVDRLVNAGGDATFAALAAEIVTSKQFRNHQAVPATGKPVAMLNRNSDILGRP